MSAPKKQCGACKACCIDLRIDTPEFRKPAGTLCAHHGGDGCGIYATRYPVCRAFLCGWLLFPELDPDWRPDKSGVLILQVPQASIPKKYWAAGHGVQFVILGGAAAIARPGFAEYVAALVSRGVAVYLTAVQPNTLVNEHLRPMVEAGDRAGILRTLQHLHGLLVAAREKKGFLRMLAYYYRLQVEKLRAGVEKSKP